MNLWIKRALGAAALGGGLLAVTAGAAGAQEVSADVSARLGRPTSAFSPLRPSVSDADALPFTGAFGDLLALAAAGLLAAGVLIVRAARPAAAATEGGEDR